MSACLQGAATLGGCIGIFTVIIAIVEEVRFAS